MSEEFSGRVDILDSQNQKVFQFDSSFAVLDLGAQGNESDLRLYSDDGGWASPCCIPLIVASSFCWLTRER